MVQKKKKGPGPHKGPKRNQGLKKKKGPLSRQGGAPKKVSSVDWDPARDSRYRDPEMHDAPQMGIEERKAAQLAKWKKELGLDS